MFPELNPAMLRSAWEDFVEKRTAHPTVSAMILNSWKRCWARINPYQKVMLNQLSQEHLLAAQVASFDLISVARPVIEDIYQSIEDHQVAVILVNSAGYILDIMSDLSGLRVARECGVVPGGFLSEFQAGTNALALALLERLPAQVVGAEHYLLQFHELADTAAPIFDLSGRPLGALGILTPIQKFHPFALSLAVAGARAIESQRQADILLAEKNSHLAEINVTLAAISEGIIVWNADRVMMRINAAAARLIGASTSSLVGRRMGDLFSFPGFLQEALEQRQPLTDVEASLRVGERTIHCILSLRFVLNHKELQWIIMTFRQEKEVRQLIQRQFGTHALLGLEDLPGESQEMRRVRRLIKSASAAQASVLIRGESGTGKNVVASAIHNESPRREEPFLIFSCASVPNELVVSELLGYDEGFVENKPGGRPGKFELAQGGTIYFLDVDALSLEAQAVLLNVLELGIVQRLGGERPIPVDVRVVASSSVPMEKLIAQGDFRADLFYRLSSFEITLPALRDRQKDLPALVERILRRLSRQMDRPLSLAPGVIELLKKYPWPGNVRELEAVLGRAAAQAGSGEQISAMHLPEFIHYPVSAQGDPLSLRSLRTFDEIERETLLKVAELCGGNVTKMAKILGLGRTTVWRKLKEFQISIETFRRREQLFQK